MILVYISQPALYALYLLYVGCRYPGAAADRPPNSSTQQASRCCFAESGPCHRNVRKLSPIYATGNMERVRSKTANEKQSTASPNPKKMRKKEKRKRSANKPDPEKNTGDFRSNYSKLLSHPCRRQADGAKTATWAATLAPSQAEAKF